MLKVNSFILEVTRKCNMCCEHCLRGDAQDMDIDWHYIDAVAQNIQPSTITFTGGEPSLNIKAIKYYFAAAKKYGTFPSSFYVVTNGKANQEKLATTLLNAYTYCDDKEMCGVTISRDRFHDSVDYENNILNGLVFYRPNDKTHPEDEYNPTWVIDEGRANENGWGMREGITLEQDIHDIVEDIIGNDVYVDEFYVSANGWCTSNCDASYDNIDENHLCHISELENILTELTKEVA